MNAPIYWSGFTRWYVATRGAMPRAVAAEIRRAAIARRYARMGGDRSQPEGYADLVARGENAVAGIKR